MEDKNIEEQEEIKEEEKDKDKETDNKEEKKEAQEETNDDNELSDDDLFRKKVEELRNLKRKNRYNVGGGFPFFLFVFLIIGFIYFFVSPSKLLFSNEKNQPITYSTFVEKLGNHDIKLVYEKDGNMYGEDRDGLVTYETKMVTDRIGQDSKVMQLISDNNIELRSVDSSTKSIILRIILNLLPMLLLIGFYIFITRRMMGSGGSGMNPFNIGKTRSKLAEKPNVKFEDVAGINEVKEELTEVVQFLKDPSKFTKVGARVPKGVLLLGEPGTGKTLLAKAVAGESGASFFSISGSEFVELYVGVGASRVRDLFEEAKKEKPSIIFIDEIDAIGRKRSVGRNGGNDEREQTLNQLLVEMDGFGTDDQVIVIAATNREDILDKALLRSGRFDRRISVPAPDLQGRIDILKVHTKNKKLAKDVKLDDIAKITPGFVGADLENIVNEAAILAARNNRFEITMSDLDEAVDKIGMGLGQKSKILSYEDRKMLAYHEGGHALTATLLPNTDKVHKVTIIPRGDAGGYTMTLPEETLNMRSKTIKSSIMVAFGGRVGELLGMDDIGTGAYSDIQKATHYARLYVRSYGLDEELGPINYDQSREEEYSFISSNSEETKKKIDDKVVELLKDLYKQTVDLLTENKEKLDEVAKLLLEKETVTGAEIRAIVAGNSANEVLAMTEEEIEAHY